MADAPHPDPGAHGTRRLGVGAGTTPPGRGWRAGFVDDARPRSARQLFVPRGSRLFVVFDDRRSANLALFQWTGGVPLAAGAWMYDGPDGARELDPDAVPPGWRAFTHRLFAFVFSANVEYLRSLSGAVRRGATVVAVHVPDRHTADDAARGMRRLGGSGITYVMHGNFVPLAPT